MDDRHPRVSESSTEHAPPNLFDGPGEMRALARALDWGATSIGPPDSWSPALRTATRVMFDSAFPLCLWAGPEFALVYNDAYRRILAAKHPAALGQPGSIVWAEIWERLEPMMVQVREGGPSVSDEDARFVMARLEGGESEEAWFSYTVSALRDEDGTIPGLLNISPETTGRVLAERALEVERARLEDVFRRAPSFIAAYRGPTQVFEFVNAAYYQIVGHREILGKPLLEALPELRGQGFDQMLEQVRQTGEPLVGRETPVILQRTPGAPLETRYVDMVLQPLTDADGTRSGVVAHGSDITEQVLARRDAERARDRADRLLALTAALAAVATIEEVADVVIAQGVAAAGAMSGILTLRSIDAISSAEPELVILRHTGIPPDVVEQYGRMPLSAGLPAATAVRTGTSVFLESREALDTHFPGLGRTWDTLQAQAIATVPLMLGDEAIGTISFTFTAPHRFPDEDREFFLALGRQAAQALERARLFQSERMARMRTESLQRVTAVLAQARTMADVGRVFSHELTTLLGAATAWVGVLTRDGSAVEALGWSGYTDETADAWRLLPIDTAMALTDAVRTARAQWWPSREALADAYPSRAAMIRTLEQEGVAVLPILDEGERDLADGALPRAVGGVVVGFRAPQQFDSDTRAFFLALAQQCAQAIARARAYAAEQEARLDAEAARRAAEAASTAKSDFLAVMSHELRTPLNAIGGYAELMEMGIRGPVTLQQRADLDRIQRAQRHLLGLINGVLNYAKVDAGAVHYELADVPLDEVLAACEALIAPQTRAKGLTLHHEPGGDGPVARADRDKVQQVVLNLLSNAVKFTGAGGKVSLGYVASGEGAVAVRVSDTGRGIAPDQLERVFQPFVQVDATLTRAHEGTGLGLAISRDLAHGMGGTLTVESTLGVGSTFTLALPAALGAPLRF